MTLKDTLRENIYYIRIVFAALSWFAIIARFVVTADEPDESFLEPLKFFTIQSNVFVATWLTLSVLYKDYQPGVNQEKMDQLYGVIRGATTAFITLTWLAYWALLSGDSDATGLKLVSSNINHYVTPIYFIIDWVITEQKKYTIKFPLIWMLYPLIYLLFAYIFQAVTDDPIYGFFDISDPEIGLSGFISQAIQLLIAFAIFCFTYFGLNKLLVKD